MKKKHKLLLKRIGVILALLATVAMFLSSVVYYF